MYYYYTKARINHLRPREGRYLWVGSFPKDFSNHVISSSYARSRDWQGLLTTGNHTFLQDVGSEHVFWNHIHPSPYLTTLTPPTMWPSKLWAGSRWCLLLASTPPSIPLLFPTSQMRLEVQHYEPRPVYLLRTTKQNYREKPNSWAPSQPRSFFKGGHIQLPLPLSDAKICTPLPRQRQERGIPGIMKAGTQDKPCEESRRLTRWVFCHIRMKVY